MRSAFALFIFGAGLWVSTPAALAECSVGASCSPPDNPSGATTLGVIDTAWPVNSEPRYMACSITDVGIKAGEPYFGSWYFHFWKQSSNTFADISMIEHPTQTLYFRLYDAQNNFLEEIKGADNERFHEARPTGDYYIQVLTDANNGHNSNGGNTARLISRFRPAERAPSAQNVEWVSTATSAIYKGAVFSIAARLTSEANVQIPFGVQKICPIGNLEEPSLDHTLDEINIGNLPKGTYSVALAMKNGVHWYPEFAVYKVPGPGEMYQKIVGGTLSHNGGTLTLGVGYYDTVQIPTQGDRYAEYELTLAKQ